MTVDLPERADVVIVGGGIAGTASAYYLAQRGLTVVVCEKGRVGGEQSTRNWGFVRQQGRDPAEIPLMMESNRIWRGLERELNADLEWIAGGNFRVFQTEAEAAEFEGWKRIAEGHGLECRLVGQAEMQQIVPDSRLGHLGGIFTASDGQAEPRKVMPALQRAAEGRGATFIETCAVHRIERAAGRISGVVTEHGPIAAPVVVLATGAWSSRMLAHMGLRFPQVWITGSVARTTAAPVVSHAATWSGVAFRQRRDGTLNIATTSSDHQLMVESLLFGRAFLDDFRKHGRDLNLRVGALSLGTMMGRFSETALLSELQRFRTLDPKPNMKLLQSVLARVKAAVPAFAGVDIDFAWGGHIDMTPDMLPVIEALDDPAGLVLATGFSGHGFGMGPIVGRLVSEIVADGRPSMDLTAFRFDRFAKGRLKTGAVI
ncbi:MAG: FAD-binding oxidoreductase [Pseudomonadota bacterium]|nr:FAD-binding oxidoreductase [Pseudomonadota bacterium]